MYWLPFRDWWQLEEGSVSGVSSGLQLCSWTCAEVDVFCLHMLQAFSVCMRVHHRSLWSDVHPLLLELMMSDDFSTLSQRKFVTSQQRFASLRRLQTHLVPLIGRALFASQSRWDVTLQGQTLFLRECLLFLFYMPLITQYPFSGIVVLVRSSWQELL